MAEIPTDDKAPRTNRYDNVIVKFGEEYFDGDERRIFAVITRFFRLTGQPATFQQFAQLLDTAAGVDASVKLSLCQQFQSLQIGSMDYAEYVHSCEMLRETTRRDMLGHAILDASDILIHGKKEGRKAFYGYDDARDFLQDAITKIDAMNLGVMPEGNINDESRDVLAEYVDRKNHEAKQYATGLDPIDQATGGIQPGELWFVAGYTEEGKSSLVTNIAYHMVYVCGLNIAYGTNETLRRQVRLRLISRHSCHPKFGGNVLPYAKLKTGKLDAAQEHMLQVIVSDMATCKDYGRFELFQLPSKATVGYIQAKFRRFSQKATLSVGIIDELRLLGSGRHRTTDREELEDIIRSTKQLAVTFGGGAGIALICPYQIARDKWAAALETGRYTKACMSNTSEAERAADAIITILRMESATRGQLVKYRDAGESPNMEFNYSVRAEVCLFEARRQQGEAEWLA